MLTADGIAGAACPNCRTQLMLTNIKPSRWGFDLRTFKCDQCNHIQKLSVETNAKRRRSAAPQIVTGIARPGPDRTFQGQRDF